MYQVALYFKNKFLRQGIILLLLSGLPLYQAYTLNENFSITFLIMPVVAVIWLYLGVMLAQKLKTKVAVAYNNEITDENFSYKKVEVIMVTVILALHFLGKHWKYVDYLMLTVALVYLFWLFKQMQKLNTYFKT